MPETPEGKIQMAKIEQKLDDHIATQSIDMNEIKSTVARIEGKLDIKANNNDVERLGNEIRGKTDNNEFLYWRNLLVSGIIVSILLMLISIVLSIVFKG